MTEIKTEQKKFYKDRFDVISEEKREQVLTAAIEEFAKNGFNGTSINKVAKRAKISIGAMYSYFESKDDLFLTVVERLFSVLELAIKDVDVDRDIFEIIEALFYRAHDYAVSYPEMNQIYLDFSTQSLSNLSGKVSKRLESISMDLYQNVIENAKAKREMDPSIDTGMFSFLVDNLIMMYQFSFTSEYYKQRMKLFLGDRLYENEKKQINEILKILRKAIQL
ncbi:MAG: TetR/AcrR family transcriptional regulator [Clostridiales bacterium]|nr:TetR/AcrR family transcriptional regulator [Clostridiales bacterium]